MSGWASLIPQTGLVNAWPFDTANTTTSTATDPIGGSNATLTSVTLNGSGPNALLNNAGVFNGSSSHGDTTAPNLPASAFTVTYWVNADAAIATGARVMANDHTDADNKGFQILAVTVTDWGFDVGNGTTFAAQTAPVTSQSAWHMVTFTWDGTTLASYTDAVAGGTTTFTGPVGTATNNLSFGFNPAYSGDFCNMMIAGVAIYNRAITGTEVTTIFNLVSAPAADVMGMPRGFLFAPVGGPARQLRSKQAFPPQVTQIMLSGRASIGARASAGPGSSTSLSARAGIQTKASAQAAPSVALAAMAAIKSKARSAVVGTATLAGTAVGKVFGAGNISVPPVLGPQEGMKQGFLFHPGAGPTWELRGRAAFPPAIPITTVALVASAFIAARASAAPSGKVALAGATRISGFARMIQPGSIALFATAFLKVMGRTAPQSSAAMSGKLTLKASASATPAGKTSLTASAKIMAVARAGLLVTAPMVGLVARALVKLTGRGNLSSFRPSPRSADAPAETRSADVPPNT
jgi:hypothetical protein